MYPYTPGTGKPPTSVQFAVIFIKEGRRSVYQFEDKEQRGRGSKAKAQLRAIPGEVLGLEYRITTDGLLGFSLMTLYFLYFEVKETLVQDFTRPNSCYKSCRLPIQRIGATGSGLQHPGYFNHT